MKYLVPFFFMSLVLASCGTEPKTVVMRSKSRTGDQPKSQCPGTAPSNYHLITIQGLGQPLPSKLGIVLDDKMEVNECTPTKEAPPKVEMERILDKEIRIAVDHTDSFNSPPKSTALKVLDLGDCKQTPRELYGNSNLSLTFEKEFPFGPSCKARQVAKLTVVVAQP